MCALCVISMPDKRYLAWQDKKEDDLAGSSFYLLDIEARKRLTLLISSVISDTHAVA